jgi:hypothetical protein
MALGSLISSAFGTTRLARDVWPFAQKINDPNHLRGPDGQAFPLPSKTDLLPGTLRSVLRPLDRSPSSADRQIEAEASALAIAPAIYARRAAMALGALKLLAFLGDRPAGPSWHGPKLSN